MSEQANTIAATASRPGRNVSVDKWLAAAAQRVRAQSAVLVIFQGKSIKITSRYPFDRKTDHDLIPTAHRAFREQRAVNRVIGHEVDNVRLGSLVCVGLSLRISGRPAAVVFKVEADRASTDESLLGMIAPLVLRRQEDTVTTSTLSAVGVAKVQEFSSADSTAKRAPNRVRPTDVPLPKSAASERTKRGPEHDWLSAAVLRTHAKSAALLVFQGEAAKVVGFYPVDRALDQDLIATAQRAFRHKRAVYRIAGEDGAASPTGPLVCVGFGLRISGRPAAVAFKLAADSSLSDAELIAKIAPLVLRRSEDKLAAGKLSPVPTPVVQQISAPRPLEKSSKVSAEIPQTKRAAEPAGQDKPIIRPPPPQPQQAVVSQPKPTSATEKSSINPSTAVNAALLREQSAVIATLATVLDHKNFAQSLHAFANGIAHTWQCLRVTIGVVESGGISIAAVSGSVDFDTRSALMVDISQALEETRSAAATIVLPDTEKNAAPPQAHLALAAQLKNPALMSVPLIDGERVVGAVLLERDHEFYEEEQHQLHRMALLVAPLIALKKLETMGLLSWLGEFARRQLQGLFGSAKLGLKLSAMAVLALIIFGSLFTQMFRVDADARIEANVHRAVVASFPSFLSQVEMRAGDIVYQGDVLARLDVEELQLDRIKWTGERDKLIREYRATLAQRDRSNVRVVEARRDQAQSQIDLLDAQIARATLRAPIDGVVVSGDLSQSLGSPVEQGQLLFEVASLDDYRIIVMVDESDIGWVELGSAGNLRLRSLPDQSFPFTVSAITPVSEPGEGANRFRVEAALAELPSSLRPGMGGVAKIDIEPRAIGWIWTRSFVNWLRFQSWKYGW